AVSIARMNELPCSVIAFATTARIATAPKAIESRAAIPRRALYGVHRERRRNVDAAAAIVEQKMGQSLFIGHATAGNLGFA
ncbi:MAG: hypothetical protein ACRES3_02155, partial [Steroidobacteraceae bacterium]